METEMIGLSSETGSILAFIAVCLKSVITVLIALISMMIFAWVVIMIGIFLFKFGERVADKIDDLFD